MIICALAYARMQEVPTIENYEDIDMYLSRWVINKTSFFIHIYFSWLTYSLKVFLDVWLLKNVDIINSWIWTKLLYTLVYTFVSQIVHIINGYVKYGKQLLLKIEPSTYKIHVTLMETKMKWRILGPLAKIEK